MNNKEYREIVMTHLQYIKEKVDANYEHLQKLNGRVHRNERLINRIIGIGITITFFISIFMTYIEINN